MRSSSPLCQERSVHPQAQRPNGRESSTRPPQARQSATPGTSTTSSLAPSTGVPALAASKQNSSASGSTAASFPTSTTTRRMRAPPLDSAAISTSCCAMPSSCMAELRDELFDLSDRGLHRRFDRGGEPDALLDGGRLAADHPQEGRNASELAGEREHPGGIHRVRLERRRAVRARLDDVDGAGLRAARSRIDEDRRLPLLEERVGQIHAANPEVDRADAVGKAPLRKPPQDLDAESVVAEEEITDAGDEDCHLSRSAGAARRPAAAGRARPRRAGAR